MYFVLVRMEKREQTFFTRRKAKVRREKLLEQSRTECNCKPKKSKKTAAKDQAQFTDLPDEILLQIFSYFSLKELLAFCQVKNIFQA